MSILTFIGEYIRRALYTRYCVWVYKLVRVKRKSAFEHAQNAQILDYPAHAQSIIRAFALHYCIMKTYLYNSDPLSPTFI